MFVLLSLGQHHVSTKYKIAIIFDSVDKLFTQMILHRQTNIFFPFARYFFLHEIKQTNRDYVAWKSSALLSHFGVGPVKMMNILPTFLIFSGFLCTAEGNMPEGINNAFLLKQ